MALVFTQTPPTLSLAQSPVAFSVYENTGLYSGSEFQYTCQLTYWNGEDSISGSYDYYLTKFPNTSGVGIFDVSRVLNSAMTQPAYNYLASVTNYFYTSSVLFYKAAFNYSYLSGSVRVSGSNQPILSSSLYKTLDGYALFPEPINQNVPSKSLHWPLMTDGPVTQSVYVTDIGQIGVYSGTTGAPVPTRVVYSGSTGNGEISLDSGPWYTYGPPTSSSGGQVRRVPSAPNQLGFPAGVGVGFSITGSYSIQAYTGSTPLGIPILYQGVCINKYTPIRIMWKNRYGQFDYLNFYKANYKTFGTDQRVYQPQLGSWDSSTLSYDTSTNNNQRFIVNTNEMLTVNSDWLQEAFNEAYKQLLVSDEIYWLYNQVTYEVKPLSIITNNVRFKTGVNDKLIQYTVDFSIGQTFKLII